MTWTMQPDERTLQARFNQGVAVFSKLQQEQGSQLRAMVLSRDQTLLLLGDVDHVPGESPYTVQNRKLAYDDAGPYSEQEQCVDGVLVRWRVRYRNRALGQGGRA